ncbi:FAD-binding protein [Chelativorans sp. ZYF759]|nr:FAD-binding protein [Chelativorans sp. ZYF759]
MRGTSMAEMDSLLSRFAAIVGDNNALSEPDDISPYLAEPRDLFHGRAAMVLRPGTTAEVAAILKLASETGTPVVPQGGNTGLVGGQIPDRAGRAVIVSLSRMNAIREIDVASRTATVEAGVVLQRLQEAADEAGLLFPLSLGAQGSCQIGGNLSSNAGGTGALVHGSARDLCLGLEVVLPTGEVLDDLRKLKKDNTGYDLKNLFVGAEGTLGIITAAVVKLVPKPRGRELAWIGLENPKAALELFGRAQERAGAALTAFELAGRNALEFVLRHRDGAADPLASRHPWYVLAEISSGRSPEDARTLMEEILGDGLERGLLADAALAQSLAQQAAFWHLREEMSWAQKPEGASIKHDISVPVAAIPDFIEKAGEAVAHVSAEARVVCFGHMGDGNLHYNVSQPVGAERDSFLALYRDMNDAVHAVVRAFEGSFSAEHGIGSMKRDELARTAPPVALDLMRRVKTAFDPAGIMNPGKVI